MAGQFEPMERETPDDLRAALLARWESIRSDLYAGAQKGSALAALLKSGQGDVDEVGEGLGIMVGELANALHEAYGWAEEAKEILEARCLCQAGKV